MTKKRILIVDDDIDLVRFLQSNLESRGYIILESMDGVEALKTFEMELPDLVILDIMIPIIDGYEVCRRIRKWSQVPVIMLSGKSDESDKVQCLDIGADDYITKPFGMEELLARIRVALRRSPMLDSTTSMSFFNNGDLRIDFVKRQVVKNGREVNLTPLEYRLLRELINNTEKVMPYRDLLQTIWGPEYETEREYLYVYIGYLRSKLESNPKYPEYIITIPGVGYKFNHSE